MINNSYLPAHGGRRGDLRGAGRRPAAHVRARARAADGAALLPVLAPMRMITEAPAPVDAAALAGKARDTLRLTWEERRWTRKKVVTTAGREIALALPTGTVLEPGDVLAVEEDWYLVVEAAAGAGARRSSPRATRRRCASRSTWAIATSPWAATRTRCWSPTTPRWRTWCGGSGCAGSVARPCSRRSTRGARRRRWLIRGWSRCSTSPTARSPPAATRIRSGSSTTARPASCGDRDGLERFLLTQLEGAAGPCDATAAAGALRALGSRRSRGLPPRWTRPSRP